MTSRSERREQRRREPIQDVQGVAKYFQPREVAHVCAYAGVCKGAKVPLPHRPAPRLLGAQIADGIVASHPPANGAMRSPDFTRIVLPHSSALLHAQTAGCSLRSLAGDERAWQLTSGNTRTSGTRSLQSMIFAHETYGSWLATETSMRISRSPMVSRKDPGPS